MVDTVLKSCIQVVSTPKSPRFQRFGAPLDTWILWIQPKSREKVKSELTQKNPR